MKADSIGAFIDYNEKINNILNDVNIKWTYDSGFNNPKYLLKNWNKIKDYENYLEAENSIAECLMLNNKKEWEKISQVEST